MAKTEWTFDEISSSHFWFLRLLGLIPLAGKTLSFFTTKLLLFYFHTMSFLCNSMWMGYGVRMAVRKQFEVEFICELMLVEAVTLRYLLLYLSRNKVIRVLNLCKELWVHLANNESQVMRNFERKAFYFRTFILINGLSVTTSFILTAFFIKIPGATVNDTGRKMLPFRFYVEVYEEPWFTLVSILQDVVTYTMAFEAAGIETFGLFVIMMSCGYLRVVRNRLLKFQNNSKSSDSMTIFNHDIDEVIRCARLHQSIMLFCEAIENTTSNVFFITVFTTIYNMSITSLKLLENDEDSFKFITIFTMNLFQFLIVQWGPEYLLIESKAIGEAAYFATMKQSKYNPKFNKVLLTMMIRAQRPYQLTAGGYINLSIETFGNMVRSAFSFFTLLRSFKP